MACLATTRTCWKEVEPVMTIPTLVLVLALVVLVAVIFCPQDYPSKRLERLLKIILRRK